MYAYIFIDMAEKLKIYGKTSDILPYDNKHVLLYCTLYILNIIKIQNKIV